MTLPTCEKCGNTILSTTERTSSYGNYIVIYCIKCGKIHGTFNSERN